MGCGAFGCSMPAGRVRTLCREICGSDTGEPFPTPAGIGSNSRQFADAPAPPHYIGHRDRLRERMMAAGPDNLPDYELLEVILFAARSSGDVKPVAKALITKFGSFAAVMAADRAALTQAGLNLAGIAAIKAAREAGLRLMHAELQERPVVSSWETLIDYCAAHCRPQQHRGVPHPVSRPQKRSDQTRAATAGHGRPHPGLPA
jgi:UPF0758 N-terminal